jgi:N-acetylglucosamine kinase-like BadF-type ATPase
VQEAAYIIGVDGGQTSTRALIARLDRTVVGQGTGRALVHFNAEGGVDRNRASIQTAILGACRDARVSERDVCSVALGLTGVQPGAPAVPIVEKIVREVASPQSVVVVPDYVTNLAGAGGGQPGIVIIAGGGSVAYGVTADGREALAGGHGYLLGDEGSGFDIGRHAVMAAIRASEGRAGRTTLEALVMQHFQVSDMRQLFHVIYDAAFSRERLAQLTPMVVRAADGGDPAAARIMRRAAHELACTCLAVIRKLHNPGDRPNIYLSGGVWSSGDVIRKPFRRYLARCWSSLDVRLPLEPPVVGALILAGRHVSPV